MIKPVGASAGTRIESGTRTSAPQRSSAPEKAAPEGDTAGAQALKVATQLAGTAPPLDTDKVAALRAAIQEARYSIDPDAIAAQMIAMDIPQKAE